MSRKNTSKTNRSPKRKRRDSDQERFNRVERQQNRESASSPIRPYTGY